MNSVSRLSILLSVLLLPCWAQGFQEKGDGNPAKQETEFPNLKPKHDVPMPFAARVRELSLSVDGKQLIWHAFEKGPNDQPISRIRLLNVENGESQAVVRDFPGRVGSPRTISQTQFDGIVEFCDDDGEISSFDLKKMESKKADPKQSGAFSVAKQFSEQSGKDFRRVVAFPASPDGFWFVLSVSGKDEDFVDINGWDVAKSESSEITQIPSSAYPLFASDAKKMVLFISDKTDPVWTEYQTWDLDTVRKIGTHRLPPDLSTIGIKITTDGKYLILHEYMVQELIVLSVDTGRPVAILDAGTGYSAFDMTPDGKTVVGIGGKWVRGSLAADRIMTFDLSEILK